MDIRKIFKKIDKLIKFSIVGVSNTIVSYLIYISVIFLLKYYKFNYIKDYYIANTIAFLISVLWSFLLNNKFVFNKNKTNNFKDILKSYIAYGFTGLILNNILSYVWVDIYGISKSFSYIINAIISTPINFIIHKIWVFKEK